MNNLLRNGSFDAVRTFKDSEQKIARWFDGSMTNHEPLHEVFADESVTGMKVYAWHELDDGCNFRIMESNFI